MMLPTVAAMMCLVVAGASGLSSTTGTAQEDLITHLPGLQNMTSYKQYSGYLQADPWTFFHYWMVESQHSPETAPVLLWLNGGPGCSSLAGFMEELGPLRVTPDGKSFVENPYSWNTFANVIFLESPTGVGFSYNKIGYYHNGDHLTAERNYNAIVEFFKKFPEFRKNEFYITGESYGGIFVPSLSVKITENMDKNPINFKGFAIGNGLYSYKQNDDSIMFFAYYHGLIDVDLWNATTGACCKDGVVTRAACDFGTLGVGACKYYGDMVRAVIQSSHLDWYNLYSRCPTSAALQAGSLNPVSRRLQGREYLLKAHKQAPATANFEAQKTGEELPFCKIGWGMTPYLDNKEVREALHIPAALQNVTWMVCNPNVFIRYNIEYKDMTDQFLELKKAGIRGLVYNGDSDMACNFLGAQWFVEDLQYKEKEDQRMWLADREVGGFVKRFEGLDLATVRGSGHFVPMDQPAAALHLIKSFVQGTAY